MRGWGEKVCIFIWAALHVLWCVFHSDECKKCETMDPASRILIGSESSSVTIFLVFPFLPYIPRVCEETGE